MSVDPNNPIPIYQQIADNIRRSIAAGVYRPGEMIPSLRVLALELTVNPNTVQRAFETLEREGRAVGFGVVSVRGLLYGNKMGEKNFRRGCIVE